MVETKLRPLLPRRKARERFVPVGVSSVTLRSPTKLWDTAFKTATALATTPVLVMLIGRVMPAGVLSGMSSGVLAER